MPTLVSLLRGVNVGGHRKIKMAELTELYRSLGFSRVRSYKQSGNVLFDAPGDAVSGAARRLEESLEETIERVFGFNVSIMIRNPEEMSRVFDNNPFFAKGFDTRFLHVAFLSGQPGDHDPEALRAAAPRGDGEDFHIAGREIYLHYPNGTGKAKLSGGYFEKRLGVSSTTRNWNSVAALTNLIYE